MDSITFNWFNCFNLRREKMRSRRERERELMRYKFLCLFVLGFCIGYFVGGAV